MTNALNNAVKSDNRWFLATTTANMRWIKRLSDPDNFNSQTIKVLQQQWKIEHNVDGVSYEWKDIPVMEE